jgi:hypothetical protein
MYVGNVFELAFLKSVLRKLMGRRFYGGRHLASYGGNMKPPRVRLGPGVSRQSTEFGFRHFSVRLGAPGSSISRRDDEAIQRRVSSERSSSQRAGSTTGKDYQEGEREGFGELQSSLE